MSSETLPERGIRLLTEEYERQKVLLAKQSDQYVANLQELAKEHPELKAVCQRLLSQHFGWV